MSVKKTLANIVAPVVLAGSVLFNPTNSYAQLDSPQKQTARTYEISEKNPRFSDKISMELYNRSLSGGRDSKGDTLPVYLEGEMDYEKGKFYFSYSAGEMTGEGPLLTKKTIKQVEKLPLEVIPYFDDGHTKAYVVSTDENISFSNPRQKAWVYNSRRNPVEVKELRETPVGKLLWKGLNKVADKAIDKGDAFITGGLSLVPYIGDIDEEIRDKLIDKFDLGPLSRLRGALEKREARLESERKSGAKKSLENAIYVDSFPVFSDNKIKLARSYEFDLANNGFEDGKVAIVLDNLAVRNRSQYGTLHGQLKDISFIVDMPSRLKGFENYLGNWHAVDVFEDGRSIMKGGAVLMKYTIEKDKFTLEEPNKKPDVQSVFHISPFSNDSILFGVGGGMYNLTTLEPFLRVGVLQLEKNNRLVMAPMESMWLSDLDKFTKQLDHDKVKDYLGKKSIIFERDDSSKESRGESNYVELIRKRAAPSELEWLVGDWYFTDPQEQKKVFLSIGKNNLLIRSDGVEGEGVRVEDIEWYKVLEKIYQLKSSDFSDVYFFRKGLRESFMTFNLEGTYNLEEGSVSGRNHTTNRREYGDPNVIFEKNFSEGAEESVIIKKIK